MASDIKEGDQVINISRYARRRDPFRVVRVEPLETQKKAPQRVLLHVVRRTAGGKLIRGYLNEGPNIVKLEPGESVQQALRAHIPASQLCEICGDHRAPERHFVTIPFPRPFTKVCGEDLEWIKETIRNRTADIVSDVFAEAKARHLRTIMTKDKTS